MATPRFLVAKYVRDMARMEPRNIGIVLWADGIVVTKFIGDVVDSDASPLPKFMARKNHRVYKRWVKYWCDAIQKEHIVGANGESVGRDDPRFLDAFSLRESRDNYILTMGGSVPVSADKLRVQETLNYLFHAFIDDGSSAELTEAKNLIRGWNRVVDRSGTDKDIQKKCPLECNVKGVRRHFKFDFAMGNGTPKALLQKALLTKAESTNSTFLMLSVVTNDVLTQDRCAAIVYAPSEQKDPLAIESEALLGTVATVINVANEDEATDRLREISRLSQT